jgi:LacI family transcriptional regulator
MRDVAALVGVSIKTVSRVVNGEPGVSRAVADKVRAAAVTVGYRPNMTASSLRRADGRSATIGVLLEDLSNPFSSALLRAVEDRARERSVLVLAGSDDDDPRQQRELLHALIVRRIDGLVVMPPGGHQDALQEERRRGLPMVVVDRLAVFADTDSVTADNRESSRKAVLHLGRHGQRRIAFLGDRDNLWTARERFEGYLEGLSELRIPLDPALVRKDVCGTEAAARATHALLEAEHPPTAVFAGQNLITVGVVSALRERGLQHRVAVIGFDDFPLADMLDPPVSVVRQDVPALGRAAADRVFARIDGEASPARHVIVPAELIARGSGEIAPS